MNQPIVYLSKDFFIHFCKIKDIPTDDIQKKKVILYVEELIFFKARIYINIADSEIIRYNLIQSLTGLDTADETIFVKNFKRILSQNKVTSCNREIGIFGNKKYADYNALTQKPHFILASYSKEFCKELEKEFGVICISNELSVTENCIKADITIIEQGKPVELNLLKQQYHFCNSLVIEDPHLFDNDIQGHFFENLLKALLSKDLKVQIVVTLIFDNTKGCNINAMAERIIKNMGLDIKIESYLRSRQNIHDRNIYTNSFWLTCDYGFKNQYTKPTKWTVLPLGIYYAEYSKRKNDSVKFIKNESVNYLVE